MDSRRKNKLDRQTDGKHADREKTDGQRNTNRQRDRHKIKYGQNKSTDGQTVRQPDSQTNRQSNK